VAVVPSPTVKVFVSRIWFALLQELFVQALTVQVPVAVPTLRVSSKLSPEMPECEIVLTTVFDRVLANLDTDDQTEPG